MKEEEIKKENQKYSKTSLYLRNAQKLLRFVKLRNGVLSISGLNYRPLAVGPEVFYQLAL